jgi:hypothetical protein
MLFSGLSLLAWLIIAWAVFTALLILLMIYRGIIGMHQENQLFLADSERAFEAESQAADARAAKLTPYIRAASGIAIVLTVAVAALFVTQTLARF